MLKKLFSTAIAIMALSGCTRRIPLAIAPDGQPTPSCQGAHEFDADAILFVNLSVGVTRDVWIFDGQYSERDLFRVYGSERVMNVRPLCSFRVRGARSALRHGTDAREVAIGGFAQNRQYTLLTRSNGRFGTLDIRVSHVRLSERPLGRSYRSRSLDAFGGRVTKMVNYVYTLPNVGRGSRRTNRIRISIPL